MRTKYITPARAKKLVRDWLASPDGDGAEVGFEALRAVLLSGDDLPADIANGFGRLIYEGYIVSKRGPDGLFKLALKEKGKPPVPLKSAPRH